MTCIRCAISRGLIWRGTRFPTRPPSVSWQGMFTCPRGLNFCHLLEKHKLTGALFDAVKTYLQERALLLHGGTIMHCTTVECLHSMRVDATLIAVSPSTKNEAGKRDPDMSQSKKGKRATRARGAIWAVKDKRKPGRVLSTSQKRRNKKHGVVHSGGGRKPPRTEKPVVQRVPRWR